MQGQACVNCASTVESEKSMFSKLLDELPQTPLLRAHEPLFLVLGVVVAQEMKEPMDDKEDDLVTEAPVSGSVPGDSAAMFGAGSLSSGGLDRDYDVSEHLTCEGSPFAFLEGKAEHIRGLVITSPITVQDSNFLIVGQDDGPF